MKYNYRCMMVLSLLALTSIDVEAQWQQVSLPGTRGGAVYCLCFQDSLLYVGISGGVFVSSDDGEHWQSVNPPLRPREYNAFPTAIISNNGTIVTAFADRGVYASSDNGRTWSESNIPDGYRATPQTLTGSGQWVLGGNVFASVGAYQSHNNGITWTSVPGLPNVSSVAVQDSIGLASTSVGFQRSTDYGSTWSVVMGGGPYGTTACPIVFSVSDVYIASSSYLENQISVSTNRGLTWDSARSVLKVNSVNTLVCSPPGSGTQYVFAATDSGVFRSSDQGASWVQKNNGLLSKLVFALAFRPNNGGPNPVLYAGTGNGLFKTTDKGDSWNVSGNPSIWFFDVEDSEIFVATSASSYKGTSWRQYSADNIYRSTISRSTDNGGTWIESFSGSLKNNSQMRQLSAIAHGTAEMTLLAGGQWYSGISTRRGIILRSTDHGVNWSDALFDSTLVPMALKKNMPDVFMNASNPQSASGGGFYRSTDFGGLWTRADSGLSSLLPSPVSPALVSRVIVFDGSKIYAGGSNNFTFFEGGAKTKRITSISLSEDNGSHWVKVSSALDSGVVVQSLVDSISFLTSLYASGQHLLLGMRADNFFSSPYLTPIANGGGFYHLWNNGSDWVVADSAFMGKSVFALAGVGSLVFAGTELGVFRTADYGATWHDVSLGMGNLFVSSLFTTNAHLYANTIAGLWRRPLSEVTSVKQERAMRDLAQRFTLGQNYPNPFNPTTYIRYSVPQSSVISLRVYDLLGREVATIFEGMRQPGEYEAIFDGSAMAGGFYLCRLRGQGWTETRKLLLLK